MEGSPSHPNHEERNLPRAFNVSLVDGHDGAKDIQFDATNDVIPTEDMITFLCLVENTSSALSFIYPSERRGLRPRYDEAIRRLHSLAELGLYGEEPPIHIAKQALEQLKSHVVLLESGRIKNDYMVRLGGWSILFALVAIVINIISLNVNIPLSKNTNSFVTLPVLSTVWAGSMIGAWTSFAIRKPRFGFEDLSLIEDDQLSPPIRLIFCGVLTIIVCLFITSGAVDVSLGTFHASSIKTSDTSAWLVGMICGVSEKALPGIVSHRASTLISPMSPQ